MTPQRLTNCCRLCLNERPLCESHIVPEFLYRPGYRDQRMPRVSMDGSGPPVIQKGIRERLLCSDCEQLINTRYEQPTSKMWRSIIPEEIPAGHQWVALTGLDYPVFKLFHLSVLWRASVASKPTWHGAHISRVSEASLRAMLLGSDPGSPDEYPFFGFVMTGPQSRRVALGTVMPPIASHFKRLRMCVLIYGGCSWHFVVAARAPVADSPCLLRRDGSMVLGVQDLTTHPFDQLMREGVAARMARERS